MTSKPKFLWANFEPSSEHVGASVNRHIGSVNLPSKAVAALVMHPSTPSDLIQKTKPAECQESSKQRTILFRLSEVEQCAASSIVSEPPIRIEEKRNRSRQSISAPGIKKDRLRPSLSEQLASIASNSTSLINNMKQSIVPTEGDCKDKPILMVYSPRTIVGKCESQFSTPVQFFSTKCRYAFHHPLEKRVEMDMNYKDMSNATANEALRALTFRVNRQLGARPQPARAARPARLPPFTSCRHQRAGCPRHAAPRGETGQSSGRRARARALRSRDYVL